MQNIHHILVVDDDDRIRNLLGKFLKDNGFFVSTSHNAENAREKLEEFIFDIIIVDVMMPSESGIEFTSNLRKKNAVPVLMLTAMGDVEDRITGLQSGADDYLPKPFEPRELLLRIHNILNRTKEKSSKILFFGNISFDIDKGRLWGDEDIFITSNEAKLLKILIDANGQAVMREELAKLCGGINERSIDVQITRLRNKIEQDPKKPRYLKTIRGKGYTLFWD
jgi:two-component system phosphate regulon response regulator OmpR